MANLFPRNARLLIANRTINLVGGNVQMAILDDTYTPSESDHYMDMGGATGPVAAELTSAGYSRQALTTKALSDDGTYVKYTSDNVDYGAIDVGTQIMAFVVMFLDTGGGDTANPVIGVYDVTDKPSNGSEITQTMPTNGWVNF